MQFLNSWATHDRKILLDFSEDVLDIFKGHTQTKSSDQEAGGILLGSVHGVDMLVTEATCPSLWDKRFRYFFERLPNGHKSIALARWKNTGGITRYLGEWHTHPEDYPVPSILDQNEWRRLAKLRRDERAVLAVIVGRKCLHVELVSCSGNSVPLAPIELPPQASK